MLTMALLLLCGGVACRRCFAAVRSATDDDVSLADSSTAMVSGAGDPQWESPKYFGEYGPRSSQWSQSGGGVWDSCRLHSPSIAGFV
jgi:hypothetical protein